MEMYVQLEANELIDKLKELSQRCGLELGPIIKEEAKFIVQSVSQNTPPPSKSAGERTLAADIQKVIIPLDYRSYEAKATGHGFYKSMAKYIRKRETEKLRALLRNPNFNVFPNFPVFDSPEQIGARHYARRGANGRTYGKPDAVAYRADSKRYYNTVKKRVGFMVSGWNPAADVLGTRKKAFANREYSGSTTQVRSHFGRNPFFFTSNTNIRIIQFQKMINTTIKYRMRTTETKIERAQRKLAINLGFTKLAAGSY